MEYPAHILIDETDKQKVQTVEQHCRACAAYASSSVPPGLEKTAYLAGLLHDMGKFTDVFRSYLIRAVVQGESVRRGSVNHTFAGVRFILERWHGDAEPPFRRLTGELLAFAAGSHHGQFDCIAPDGTDGFLHRLAEEGSGYEAARERFLACCAGLEELDRLFDAAVKEVAAAKGRLFPQADSQKEMMFYFSLLGRLLLSGVIEGDRLDTFEFMGSLRSPQHRWDDGFDWQVPLSAVKARISGFPADSLIDRARRDISAQCLQAAGRGSGVYRLNVPTGGGKTLSSLLFALAEAAAKNKRRIFFVTPLLSVLEQNALAIRSALGDDSIVLEHHSNVLRPNQEDDELDENELLMENWRAPVVITTLVQLLNTLFAGQTTCIRRMSALSECVLVIDEVQSVPAHMLSLFNLAMNFLSSFCGVTVVLCSATQPCLEKASHPLRYGEPEELVPYDAALWEIFRRTEIADHRCKYGFTPQELADFSVDCARRTGSSLLVCNTKKEAREIYQALPDDWGGLSFHLSTSLCMEHRKQTTATLEAALEASRNGGRQVVCISTQLIEAGVNLSFGSVNRVLAGIDNVVQAAGRCNRNGERPGPGPVCIVNIQGENLSRLREIQNAQQAAQELLECYRRSPEAFEGGLSGECAIRTYYQNYYAQLKVGEQDYPLPEWNTTFFELLSVNQRSRGHCPTASGYTLGQAFRTAGESFRVFDDDTVDVLTPFGGGAELIAELNSGRAGRDLFYRMELIRQASLYSVSLYRCELDQLQEKGGVYPVCGGSMLALSPEYYSEQTGLSPAGKTDLFLEV